MNVVDRVELVEKQLDNLITKAELWQLIFDECPIAIACFDETMRFYLVNEAFCSLTGYKKSDLIGEKLQLVLPPKYRKQHLRYEVEFSNNPEARVNRQGLAAEILDIHGDVTKVDIDITFINYLDRVYYTAFLRRK